MLLQKHELLALFVGFGFEFEAAVDRLVCMYCCEFRVALFTTHHVEKYKNRVLYCSQSNCTSFVATITLCKSALVVV